LLLPTASAAAAAAKLWERQNPFLITQAVWLVSYSFSCFLQQEWGGLGEGMKKSRFWHSTNTNELSI